MIVDDKGEPVAAINDGDSVIFFNFRADRARRSPSFTEENFQDFEVSGRPQCILSA